MIKIRYEVSLFGIFTNKPPSINHNALDRNKLKKSIPRQFSAYPALLHAAERKPWIRLDNSVNCNHSSLELLGNLLSLAPVLGPNRGSETELCTVRNFDCLRLVIDNNYRRNRSESLFPADSHVCLCIHKDRRLIEESLALCG